jgi:hypothetical protein
MPGWLKALLIVAIVGVLLIVGVIGAGYVWWVRNRDSIKAQAKEKAAAGREFGNNADNQGCVDETFLRYKKESPGFFNALNYGQFMQACLEVSRPTPGFCDDVPVGEFMEMAQWRESRCRHYDVPNDQKCGQLIMPEVMFCGEKKRGERDKG